MVRPRPSRGERRIDAAIDHLAEIGFPRPQIRKVINDLLKVTPSPLLRRLFIILEEPKKIPIIFLRRVALSFFPELASPSRGEKYDIFGQKIVARFLDCCYFPVGTPLDISF